MKGGGLALLARLLGMVVFSAVGSEKMVTFLAKPNQKDLAIIADLMATGNVVPVIDRCYSLSDVPKAIRHLQEGHPRGKIVITLERQ
jgi:D-arabinose 1-dehydrogenase-like Zn-dependent alcohol dehydrogenase